jgi:L-lysine exporter family protein LysE/ArgO
MSTLSIYLNGFSLCAGLIIAIGAQNAFVLRQGLRRQHVLAVAGTCILSDATMFTIGAVGVGSLVAGLPWLKSLTAWGGAIFLLVYGFTAFRSAWRGSSLEIEPNGAIMTRRTAIMTALAVSALNPHAWLDTVVLAGGIAGQYPAGERAFFLLGSISASFTWFLLLGYGAGFLAPLFKRPAAWRVLDVGVGLIMWAIAAGLILGEVGPA